MENKEIKASEKDLDVNSELKNNKITEEELDEVSGGIGLNHGGKVILRKKNHIIIK